MVSVEASGGVAQAIQGTNEPRRHSIYLVTRYLLLLEGVLNLLAGVFEVGLRLVALALIFSALVAGDLADRFLDLAAKLVELVLRLILTAHSVCPFPMWESTRWPKPQPEANARAGSASGPKDPAA